jgi:flagellar basal body rod protein FlgB
MADMLNNILGSNATLASLKGEMNASARAMREIGHRVANSSTPGFQGVLDEAMEGDAVGEGVDLESEMVALADEQLRFEAASQLVKKLYQQVRISIREG